MRTINRTGSRFAGVVVGILMATVMGFGQEMQRGQVEATGQVGLVAGIGTHASFGGAVGAAYTDRVFLQGEISYIPLGGGRISVLGVETEANAKAINFNFGAQYLFPASGTFLPYVGAGIGLLHSTSDVKSSLPGGFDFSSDSSSNDFYFNFGGGGRYHMGERWGFKPEVMIFAGSNTYVRLGAGLFYQF